MVIECKDVFYDLKELFVFEFKNIGKEFVMVINVVISCGCIKVE